MPMSGPQGVCAVQEAVAKGCKGSKAETAKSDKCEMYCLGCFCTSLLIFVTFTLFPFPSVIHIATQLLVPLLSLLSILSTP